jgi:DNA-binding MarR family transcriptional regulator
MPYNYTHGETFMRRDPPPGISPCIGAAMRKASRRLTQLYDDALGASGLRSTQYTILAEVERLSGMPPTMAELAQALVMDRSALGHNLRPLERDGFVTLQASKMDRRRRHVVMTARGRVKLREAQRLWKTAQDRFAEVFGGDKAARLRETLLEIAHEERLAILAD